MLDMCEKAPKLGAPYYLKFYFFMHFHTPEIKKVAKQRALRTVADPKKGAEVVDVAPDRQRERERERERERKRGAVVIVDMVSDGEKSADRAQCRISTKMSAAVTVRRFSALEMSTTALLPECKSTPTALSSADKARIAASTPYPERTHRHDTQRYSET